MANLVVALDYPEASAALQMARALQGTGAWVKVGLELFTKEGPDVVRAMRKLGLPVMLDLKFYDIPNTVQGCVRSACALDIGLLTLHIQGGERMIRAAVAGVDEATAAGCGRPLLFGVTVLTSMGPGEQPGIAEDLSQFATQLAGKGAAWGLDGVVCSGHEVQAIKRTCPQLRCLTPGIRPADGGRTDDQRRTMTPEQAVAVGSDFLVVGRPITKATDPAQAARAILTAMDNTSSEGRA